MDGNTIIGIAQIGLLFAIALQLGGLKEKVTEHARRIGVLERKKG